MFVTDFEKIDFVLPAELKHILLFELHFEPLQDQFLKYQFEVVRILFHGFLQVFFNSCCKAEISVLNSLEV